LEGAEWQVLPNGRSRILSQSPVDESASLRFSPNWQVLKRCHPISQISKATETGSLEDALG